MSSDFVRQPLMKKLNKKNPMSRIEKLEANKAQPSQRVEAVSEVAQSAGTIVGDNVYPFPVPNSAYISPIFTDFIETQNTDPWEWAAIGAGTFTREADNEAGGNYGIFSVTQSGANTGAACYVRTALGLTKPYYGAVFETVMKLTSTDTGGNTVVQLGWMDTTGTAAETDYLFVRMIYGSGPQQAAQASHGVGGSVIISADTIFLGTWDIDTWLKVRIQISGDGTSADFSVSSKDGRRESITRNLDTGIFSVGTLPMVKAYKTTAGTQTLAHFDYIAAWTTNAVRW